MKIKHIAERKASIVYLFYLFNLFFPGGSIEQKFSFAIMTWQEGPPNVKPEKKKQTANNTN